MSTGKYTFRWEHPASEVYVTGTFDDWGKSVKLEKNSEGVFEKEVELPKSEESVYYKFVKDGEWVTSHTAPTETDSSGNTNNVLKPADIVTSSAAPAAPASSTAAMAGSVPTEAEKASSAEKSSSAAPGAFPETPAAEPQDFSVKPIPASEGTGNPVDLKPGEKVPDPSTINSNTIESGVHDDPELKAADEAKAKEGEQTFGVNPIPASSGTGNPVDLKPGEPVPPASEVTSNTVNSTVKTDKESYEKSDAYPGDDKPVDTQGGAFGVPPVTGAGIVPESSLPIGKDAPSGKDADPGVTIQSSGPESTTAGLAAQVPLEKDKKLEEGVPEGVPEVVAESQKEAHVDPEASANPEAVKEKSAVESELLKDVKTTDEAGEPAPTETAATTETAPKAEAGESSGTAAAAAAAGVNTEAPVEPNKAGTQESGLAAPDPDKPLDSRDVSPMSKQPSAVPVGAKEGEKKEGEPTPRTPKKNEGSVGRRMSAAFTKLGGGGSSAQDTPDSKTSATPESKKGKEGKEKKRSSFFGKLKEAFK